MLNNENEYIYRHIDEAKIKETEAQSKLRLKELELEEKEQAKTRKERYIAFAIAGVFAVISILTQRKTSTGVGFLSLLIALFVAIYAINLGRSNKKKTRHAVSDVSGQEVEITEAMYDYSDQNYNKIAELYRGAGFSNINLVPLRDLNILSAKKDGQVEEVTISGKDVFNEGDIFPKSSHILISYHSLK